MLQSWPCVAGWFCHIVLSLWLLKLWWLVKSWVLYFMLHSEASSSDEWSFSCYFLYIALLSCCCRFINERSFGWYVTRCFAVMPEASSVNEVLAFTLCMPHFWIGVTAEASSMNEVWLLLCYVTHCFAFRAETSCGDEWSFVYWVCLPFTAIILTAHHQYIKSLLLVLCALPECDHTVSFF